VFDGIVGGGQQGREKEKESEAVPHSD